MSNNSKTKQAFPGRTGMGIESGMSKLEYVTVQLASAKFGVDGIMTVDIEERIQAITKLAKQIIAACEAVEKAGQ